MANSLYFKLATGSRTKEQILLKIASIDALIDSLLETAMKSVATGNMIEYEIDTGQTKQRVQYSTTASVLDSIQGYEKIRQMYQNQLLPRSFTLKDSRNFKRR